MNIEQYQKECKRTVPKDFRSRLLANMTLSLCEEAGEVASPIKKHIFHGHELNKEKIIEEMGDLMFYANNLMTLLDIEMTDVLDYNIKKISERYPNGFNEHDSINREI
jgi:NTP pyrophosphatase (non-canonical NTP hydrolase)